MDNFASSERDNLVYTVKVEQPDYHAAYRLIGRNKTRAHLPLPSTTFCGGINSLCWSVPPFSRAKEPHATADIQHQKYDATFAMIIVHLAPS